MTRRALFNAVFRRGRNTLDTASLLNTMQAIVEQYGLVLENAGISEKDDLARLLLVLRGEKKRIIAAEGEILLLQDVVSSDTIFCDEEPLILHDGSIVTCLVPAMILPWMMQSIVFSSCTFIREEPFQLLRPQR